MGEKPENAIMDSTPTRPSESPSSRAPTANQKHVSPPWILQHILDCPVSNELPVRVMFSFNSGQKLPTLKQAHQWWQYEPKGKLIIEFLSSLDKISPSADDSHVLSGQNHPSDRAKDSRADHAPQDRFMDTNNDLLLDSDFASSLPEDQQPSQGLPPEFIKNTCLNRVFLKAYDEVDFIHALTGLDYLRDLESTRRASLRDAAHRLGITKDNWRDVLAEDPDAKSWVDDIQKQELAVEVFYANIFIDIRIWTMINELKSEPFYKPNVLAMLNTLFPPSIRELPNRRINCDALYAYRNAFYRYIPSIEIHGSSTLDAFVKKQLSPGTQHSWPETRENLERYLELADLMIKQASAVHSTEFFRDRSSSHYSTESAENSSSSRPTTGSTTNTSFEDQPAASMPKTPSKTFDASGARSRIYSRRKLSTQVQEHLCLEQHETPSSSKPIFHSKRTFRAMTPSKPPSARPRTPLVDNNSAISHHRALSIPTTPFKEINSEASRHESFSTPAEPLRTSDGRPSRSLDLPSRGTLALLDSYHMLGNKGLPSDNLNFLQPPSDSFANPVIKTRSSFGSFFHRRKLSAGSSTPQTALDNQIAFGLPLRRQMSMDAFPRPSNESKRLEGQLPRNQANFIVLKSTDARPEEMRPESRATKTYEIDQPIKPQVRKKMSFSTLFSKAPASQISEPVLKETGDIHDQFTLYTAQDSVRKTRSQSSPAAAEIAGNITPASWYNTSRRRPMLSKSRPAGIVITSSDMKELSLIALKSPWSPNLNMDSEEYKLNERTRQWFLEEARAKKHGLEKPERRPIQDKKITLIPFEKPRATPKVPEQPTLSRKDNNFVKRAVLVKQKPKKHTPIDISKYARY